VDGSNLHAFWDNLLGNPRTVGNIGARAESAIEKFGQRGPKAAKSMDGLVWAQESHELAKEVVYTKQSWMLSASTLMTAEKPSR
jgi:hypothetical protein